MNAIAFVWIPLVALAQAPASDRPAGVQRDGTPSPPAARAASDAAAKSLDELKQAAARYRITLGTVPPRDLVLVPDPVLRWANPLRRTADGATFVWVADGRPEVVASFYRYSDGSKVVEDDEFQSLAATTLTATRSGTQVWAPRAAGMVLAPIPGAPKPARTPAERLRQMHALAAEFRASINSNEDKTEFRLLSKPLYRYPANRPDLADGALFAYVLTTDPEVLLVIESRPLDGAAAWHYGFARMSMIDLKARHKDRDVWSVPWNNKYTDPSEPYVTLRGSERAD
jgi:hypothetical protein